MIRLRRRSFTISAGLRHMGDTAKSFAAMKQIYETAYVIGTGRAGLKLYRQSGGTRG